MQNEAGDLCVVCGKSTTGDFTVGTLEGQDGAFVIEVKGTPDRDFNVCDMCNDTVHFKCSKFPESGYCDKCYYGANPDSDSLL